MWTNYYVSKSKLNWDVDYFERFFLEHDPHTDPDMFFFQNCSGEFDIHILGVDIVNIESHIRYKKRYHFESDYDEDFVICPTLESILNGNVPLPFRVNHDQFFPHTD